MHTLVSHTHFLSRWGRGLHLVPKARLAIRNRYIQQLVSGHNSLHGSVLGVVCSVLSILWSFGSFSGRLTTGARRQRVSAYLFMQDR